MPRVPVQDSMIRVFGQPGSGSSTSSPGSSTDAKTAAIAPTPPGAVAMRSGVTRIPLTLSSFATSRARRDSSPCVCV